MSNPLSSVEVHYRHPSEIVCCGTSKDRVVGLALLIMGLLVAATAGWLLSQGVNTIPSFTSGCAFAIASLGLFSVSIVMLLRKNQLYTPRESQIRDHEEDTAL